MNNVLSWTMGLVVASLLTLSAALNVATHEAPEPAYGSVMIGGEYHSTTTRRMPTGTAISNLSVLKSGPGTLGSVTVTGAGAGVITLYDATSTDTNTQWGTTTLATFPASAAAGTYTFDVAFSKGLLIEVSGTVPTSTVTFR